MNTNTIRIGLSCLVLALVLPSLAAAGHFDFYGGYRSYDADDVDDSYVGGFRAGLGIGPHASLDFNAGWSDFRINRPGSRIDGYIYNFDASLMASPGDGPFYILIGLGGADADLRFRGNHGSYFRWETSFTMNGGLGFKIPLGQSPTYLRPEFRARWYEKPSTWDFDFTIGFGFGR